MSKKSQKSKIEYFVPESQVIPSWPDTVSITARKIVQEENGKTIIIEGHGMKVKQDTMISGVIDSVLITDSDGKKLYFADNIDMDAKATYAPVIQGMVLHTFYFGRWRDDLILGSTGNDELLGLVGNDTIKGRDGDDLIDGGAGNDILSGDAGSDRFVFKTHYGRDRILDFDADGSDGAQDFIKGDFGSIVSKTNVDGNAVLDFGSKDVLTLVGVAAEAIDAGDFV
jgi:Ca2+-binding RTX toxin-like protein